MFKGKYYSKNNQYIYCLLKEMIKNSLDKTKVIILIHIHYYYYYYYYKYILLVIKLQNILLFW